MGLSYFGVTADILFFVSVSVGLFLISFALILLRFFLCLSRFLKCLLVLENFNVLILLSCALSQVEDRRMLFISLMVVSTIEAVLGLVVLTRV